MTAVFSPLTDVASAFAVPDEQYPRMDVAWAWLALAFMSGALAVIFRRGTVMQRDTEGLV